MSEKPNVEKRPEPKVWTPWSRRKYYAVQAILLGYFLFWLWAWYGIVYKAHLPLAVRILIGIVLFFTKPNGVFFEPYEKAMKRMARLRGESLNESRGAHLGEMSEGRRSGRDSVA